MGMHGCISGSARMGDNRIAIAINWINKILHTSLVCIFSVVLEFMRVVDKVVSVYKSATSANVGWGQG